MERKSHSYHHYYYSGNAAKQRYRFSLPSVCGEAGRKVEVHYERLLLFLRIVPDR